MKKIIDWLAKSNIFLYSLSLSAIVILIKGTLYALKDILKISDIQFREELVNDNFEITINLAINTLILAPVLETLIFQTLFLSVSNRFKINKLIIALISGVAFGAFHNYSVFYMIQAALIGFIFMYMYILRAEINNKPLVSTIMAHLTLNLSVTIAVVVTHFCKYGTWF